MPSILVYGGSGALGSSILKAFKTKGWTTYSVDLHPSGETSHPLTITGKDAAEDTTKVVKELGALKAELDVLYCAAGGWVGGSVNSDDVFQTVDKMWKFNLQSALASAHVATKFLKPGGLLVLTGAVAALTPTPGMIGYGFSKVATHHLIKTLATEGGGLPNGATVVGVLPVTLDTPSNRVAMPTANFDDWTPVEEVANKVLGWAEGKERPENGDLLAVVTKNKLTSYEKH
eukprot:TRINITY_DN10161_c0_g1_i1.p1 TRINITY_DN10161_c0_g1~~TRINITY_DN10161_c0_g1_i1.p1  ORF type:complete len:249 (-),score=80.40 TRINITY_DN10161_c0_g1_i1:56-748(-)